MSAPEARSQGRAWGAVAAGRRAATRGHSSPGAQTRDHAAGPHPPTSSLLGSPACPPPNNSAASTLTLLASMLWDQRRGIEVELSGKIQENVIKLEFHMHSVSTCLCVNMSHTKFSSVWRQTQAIRFQYHHSLSRWSNPLHFSEPQFSSLQNGSWHFFMD